MPLAIVSSYFNVRQSKYRRDNFLAFRAGLDAIGIPSLTVEWAPRDGEFELPEDASIIRISGGDTIWQTAARSSFRQ